MALPGDAEIDEVVQKAGKKGIMMRSPKTTATLKQARTASYYICTTL
jgi:hypothetical protein